MTLRRPVFRLFVRIALLITASTWAWSQDSDHFHWTGKLAPDQLLQIRDINGNIEASGVDSDEIVVDAMKSGPDANQVKVNVVNSADGVTICAVWPSDEGAAN